MNNTIVHPLFRASAVFVLGSFLFERPAKLDHSFKLFFFISFARPRLRQKGIELGGSVFRNAQRIPFRRSKVLRKKDYLPDVVGRLSDGTPFIAEAGMEDDKRSDRNLAKAEAARRLSRIQRGTFWIGTVRRVGVHGIPTTGRKG